MCARHEHAFATRHCVSVYMGASSGLPRVRAAGTGWHTEIGSVNATHACMCITCELAPAEADVAATTASSAWSGIFC